MHENIFEKHDDEFIEKINLKLKFPEFPLNKRTTGDFSRFFNGRNDSFTKIFKKPFPIETPEESTMLNQADSSQANINNQNINQVIENIENKLEKNIENKTGDFSRFFNGRNDSFTKIFKKPFTMVAPDEPSTFNPADSSQTDISI